MKVAVTGPESTGKTTLASSLADHFNGVLIPECARSYLNNLKHAYTQEDLNNIAHKQIKAIEENISKYKKYLFADTELLVIKIWYENAFKKCPNWILDALNKQNFDLYLLCNIDTPWVFDTQREHPHLRSYFFKLYVNELNNLKWPYAIVSGTGQERLENAIKIIQDI